MALAEHALVRFSVSACVRSAETVCQNKDMTPTGYLLATAANDQKRLITSAANSLMKTQRNKNLRSTLHTAGVYSARNRALSWTYPASVQECPESLKCSAQTLSTITAEYFANSNKLNNITKNLVRKIRAAGQTTTAEKISQRGKILVTNIQGLMKGIPKATSTCH